MTPSAAERAWKTLHSGRCPVCTRRGPLLRHHVFYAQHVRREHGDVWDLRNALPICRFGRCHGNHHSGAYRIPLTMLPDAALEFGVELLGQARAAAYLRRRYSGEDDRVIRIERESQ